MKPQFNFLKKTMSFDIEAKEKFIQKVMDKVVPYFDQKGFNLSSIRNDIRIYFTDVERIYGCIGCHQYIPKESLIRDHAHHEILISSRIHEKHEIIEILIHELCHAIQFQLYGKNVRSHGREFRQIAMRVGLTGKMTATYADEDLADLIFQWIEDIDPFKYLKRFMHLLKGIFDLGLFAAIGYGLAHIIY
jgi:uncharacterized protein (UPF0297 family)